MRFSIVHTFVLLFIGFAAVYSCSGCAPSQADRQEIISRLEAYESTRQDEGLYDNSIKKAKITVFLDQAEAKYSVSTLNRLSMTSRSQFAFVPTQMNLKKIDGQWTVVSETRLYPAWPHRKLETIPVEQENQK